MRFHPHIQGHYFHIYADVYKQNSEGNWVGFSEPFNRVMLTSQGNCDDEPARRTLYAWACCLPQ